MLSEFRHCLRALRRSRGLALTAIGVLGVSAALAATVFSVVDTVLLRPLPVHAPEQLRYLYSVTDAEGYSSISYDSYERLLLLRGSDGVFSDVAVAGRDRTRVAFDMSADVALAGEVVSGNYFSLLGVSPVIGRTLGPSDDAAAAAPVVLISESIFTARYGADPAVIGRAIHLKPRARGISSEPGRSYTIVGVVGHRFRGVLNPLEPSDYWVPIRARARDYVCDDPQYAGSLFLTGLARLNPGVSDTVGAERVSAAASEPSARPGRTLGMTRDRRVNLPFGGGSIVPENVAYALFAVCLILLAIATSNLVGLLMAHNVARRAEYATRLILGASPRRLTVMIFLEGATLAVVGCAVGLWLSFMIAHSFSVSVPLPLGAHPVSLVVEVGRRTIFAMLPIALTVTIAISLPTAIQLVRSRRLTPVFASEPATPRGVRAALRWAVVFPQVILSVMLLTLAGVLLQTLTATQVDDLGFDSRKLAFMEFEFPRPGRCLMQKREISAANHAERWRVVRRLESEARNLPGVESSTVATFLPVDQQVSVNVLRREGEQGWRTVPAARADIGMDYFRTMRIPVLQGREFSAADVTPGLRLAVISRTLAEALWPGSNPVGRSIGIGDPIPERSPQWTQVIGVVGDVVPAAIGGWRGGTVYLLVHQTGWVPRALIFRHRGELPPVVTEVTEAARRTERQVEILRVASIDSVIAGLRLPRRLATALLSLSGLIGMLLASVGVFGLLVYSVRQRAREMAIRAALGAGARSIASMVVKEGLALGLTAAVLGIALACGISRMASSVSVPLGLPTPVVVIATLLGVATIVSIASYIPAKRASSVSPASVLNEP